MRVFSSSGNLSVDKREISGSFSRGCLDSFNLLIEKALSFRLDDLRFVGGRYGVLKAKINADTWGSGDDFGSGDVTVADDCSPEITTAICRDGDVLHKSHKRLPVIETLYEADSRDLDSRLGSKDLDAALITRSFPEWKLNRDTFGFKAGPSCKSLSCLSKVSPHRISVVLPMLQPHLKLECIRPKPQFDRLVNSLADFTNYISSNAWSELEILASIDHIKGGARSLARVDKFKVHRKEAIVELRRFQREFFNIFRMFIVKFKFDFAS